MLIDNDKIAAPHADPETTDLVRALPEREILNALRLVRRGLSDTLARSASYTAVVDVIARNGGDHIAVHALEVPLVCENPCCRLDRDGSSALRLAVPCWCARRKGNG